MRGRQKGSTQLELPIERPVTPDRNADRGGRSFYFFDFDDNVMHLKTPLFLFHKSTGAELQVSTGHYAEIGAKIGEPGPWCDYELRLDNREGSFRRFREQKLTFWNWLRRQKQPLVEDMHSVLSEPDFLWRGPSWDFFWHAVHNGRPISLITARGHNPQTFKKAIRLLRLARFLTREPNYLGIFPVTCPSVRAALGDAAGCMTTAQLKKAAILKSVEDAFRRYGQNPAHRFGMSDDDPANIALIIDAMRELKACWPKNSFFVINTNRGQLVKQEVLTDGIHEAKLGSGLEQMPLFNLVDQVNASHMG